MPLNLSKYAQIERERRFLLRELPIVLQPTEFKRITDRYILNTRLRLRLVETAQGEVIALKLTQKYALDAQPHHQRVITNTYLNQAEFDQLSQLPSQILIKRRYTYQFECCLGIDVFEATHTGLILAEIEAETDQALLSLPLPESALKEVTHEPCFTGGYLATLTESQFQPLLQKFLA